MDPFLASTDVIDWRHRDVAARALSLRGDLTDHAAIAQGCFEWVRDEIKHTTDHKLSVVTCSASDVLREGSGYCYAKSHLLAALLRANDIPTGFCYQRLAVDDPSGPFCLHGLNAVWLPLTGWYRIDARGNRHDVDAQFRPPVERLAFPIVHPGEADLPEIWPEPLPVVVSALRVHTDAVALGRALPDVALWTTRR
ncbi:MAG: transglutaminase family protein [Acidobacteriota bacterium]